MAAKTTAPAATESKLHACACSKYEIEIWTGEVPEGADPNEYVKYISTDCDAQTTRVFAPGHDAKLKSLLIQAGAGGDGVRTEEGGMASTAEAMHWAEFYGFGHMVRNGIVRETERRAARNAKKAAKAAKPGRGKSAKALTAQKAELAGPAPVAAPKVVPVDIKIGRWTYAATVDADGVATYADKKGIAKTAAAGTYKIIPAEFAGAEDAGF